MNSETESQRKEAITGVYDQFILISNQGRVDIDIPDQGRVDIDILKKD